MATDDRWTDATALLLAEALHDWEEKVLAFQEGTEPSPFSALVPQQRDYATDRAEVVLLALAEAGVLLPPGGVAREEWGERVYGVILATTSRNVPATYRRTVVNWPVEGEPNDNWPRYTGPWTEIDHA